MNYVDKIKKYREERGLSQREMAAFLGIAQSFLSLVEREKANIENEDVLKKIEELDFTEEEEPTLNGKTVDEVVEAIAKKFEEQEEDVVNSPKHYKIPGCDFEVIDLIYAFVQDIGGKAAVNIGNVVKYLARAERKNGRQDYEKAIKYLSFLVVLGEINKPQTLNEIAERVNSDWLTIISGITEGMDLKKALILNEVFSCVAFCRYGTAEKYLDQLLAL